MGGSFPAGGWGWAWCDVEVPQGNVRSGDKRAQDCHVSVLHATGAVVFRLENSRGLLAGGASISKASN